MSLLDAMAAQLETAGVGTVKTSSNAPAWPIYKGGSIPNGVAQPGIWLTEYPRQGALNSMGSTLGAMEAEVVGLQAVVRHAAYDTGRAKAEAITTALHRLSGTFSGVKYALVMHQSGPFPLQRDGDAAWIFSVNFEVTKDRG